MVFDSIFGKSKKQELGKARADQFRNAWLLANRGMLAALSQNAADDTVVEEEKSLVERAQQVLRDDKATFTAEAHHTEQLAFKLLPVIEQMYAYWNRFADDADVSSAHNATFARILELVTARAVKGEAIGKIPAPEDFTDEEAELLASVNRIIADFWNAKSC